jgi:hypothetical protein
MLSWRLLLYVVYSAVQGLLIASNSDHLVVLSHGIMGTSQDLNYLAEQLERRGCVVLRSTVNERSRSLSGIKRGGELLAGEIEEFAKASGNRLRRISIVGNSLGGLYARYATKVLHEGKFAGLEPHKFLTIASPHLGVRNWTFAEDYGIASFIPALDLIKQAVSYTIFSTGREIFAMDGETDSDSTTGTGNPSLLYRMATEESFLNPLRSFASRRLYANLQRDFVVPLGTAAFISNEKVQQLRLRHRNVKGFVSRWNSTASATSGGTSSIEYENQGFEVKQQQTRSTNSAGDIMMKSLDTVGWEKIIVNFPGILPSAHNKICALSRKPEWLYSSVLGFDEGKFVMNDATEWIAGRP